MKILHISKYYAPFIGGVEQVARDCAHALKDADQQIFCFNHEKGDAQNEVDGIKVVRAGCFAKIASQSLSMSYKKLLKRQMKEFEPDIVIFHFPNPFAAHYLLKELKKYPKCRMFLWWHLDITKQKILGKLFRGQTLKLLKRAEKVIATSPNYIEGSKFLPSFRDKCVVIPNCASADHVSVGSDVLQLAEELKSQFKGKTLLFALGRHVPYKGMEYLVRASKLLGEDYAVCIGGDGPLTESLKELAKGDEKVRFLGKIDDITRKAYLRACDIFCFPSITKNEAFGIALAEAMAFEKPAVTFTIEGSGVNYVSLNNVTGIEVKNEDVSAYAQAIETLANDTERRLSYGKAAKERFESLFTEEAFHHNVSALFTVEKE